MFGTQNDQTNGKRAEAPLEDDSTSLNRFVQDWVPASARTNGEKVRRTISRSSSRKRGPRATSSETSIQTLIAARHHAAVDDDLGAGDEACLVGGEEQRRVGRVAAVAHEAQRDA